jgi:hypothetical protein
VKRAICKLCLKEKPLCESHLMPRALHTHCGKIPIRVGDGVVVPTTRHLKHYLLCEACEDILSNGGETWLCPKLIWPDRSFPLFDMLPAPEWGEENGAIYYAYRNPEISIDSITHFALGIFWKASVHSWKGDSKAPLIELGENERVLRGWLRGESTLPEISALTCALSRPALAQITFNWPVEIPQRHEWRSYTFHALGASFSLRAGNHIPRRTLETCFYHSEVHPILVSDAVSSIIRRRQMEQFFDARQTNAYKRTVRKS